MLGDALINIVDDTARVLYVRELGVFLRVTRDDVLDPHLQWMRAEDKLEPGGSETIAMKMKMLYSIVNSRQLPAKFEPLAREYKEWIVMTQEIARSLRETSSATFPNESVRARHKFVEQALIEQIDLFLANPWGLN